MKPIVREHFEIELRKARTAIEAEDFESTWIALQSDRVFGYAMLYRAMPDVMIWLSVCALLGVINGILQTVV